MPYLELKTSIKLTDLEKSSLRKKFGELISIIPGKSEQNLMIAISDGYDLSFKGLQGEPMAYIEIKMFKESLFESKSELTRKIFEFLETGYGIASQNVYLNVVEYDCWGYEGHLHH